jgi:hypothetical protein
LVCEDDDIGMSKVWFTSDDTRRAQKLASRKAAAAKQSGDSS